MPIDLASVNWIYVAVLAVFVFIASLLGNFLSFYHRGLAAFLSAILFAAGFVFWSYYPHNLPLPTRLAPEQVAAPAAPAAAAPAPVKPLNPVRTISPPQ